MGQLAGIPFGPFSVSAKQISELGTDFVPFVNELLRVESSAADLDGGQLTTTYLENIGDRGVDAGLRRATKTQYIPAGDSAWQFKAGDLRPAGCKEELLRTKKKSHSEALDVVRNGGSYRLVLGADLTDTKVKNRRNALEQAAASVGIEHRPGAFEILQASDLAAWAEQHPALAVSPILGGIGNVALPFTEWSRLNRLNEAWVSSTPRDELASAIRDFVTEAGSLDLHVEGVSGIGKTRAVLEAIRGQSFEPLIAYISSADLVPASLINQLQAQKRRAVLVIDECDAREHERLAQQLPAGSPIKFVTIGEPSGYRGRGRTLVVGPLEETVLRQIVRDERPGLSPEHITFVVDVCTGNPRLAQILADDIAKQPTTTVNDLITADIISTYITKNLPTGKDFLACCAIALFPNLGYDAGPAAELAEIADALDLSVNDLRAAIRHLDDAGMLSHQGRYRSVAPQPLALHLARRGWEDFHDQIVERLLLAGNPSIVTRLFQRAAELGEFSITRDAVGQLLEPGGLFADLGPDGAAAEGLLLSHLAAIAPGEICGRIEAVLEGTHDEDLQDLMLSWRGAEYALERLAWRSITFSRAANAMLRIARLSAGVGSDRDESVRRWVDLFGTMLPTTAASPAARLEYLRGVAQSADAGDRILAVSAADRALRFNEVVFGSLMAQGSMLVERRGLPDTWDDVWSYKAEVIGIVGELAQDADPQVAVPATTALTRVIHPILTNEVLRTRLGSVLAGLPADGLRAVRAEVTHLKSLFQGSDGGDADTEQRAEGLRALEELLPPPTTEETVAYLADVRRWDLADGELQARLDEAVALLPAEDRVEQLLRALDRQPEGAYEVGHVLGDVAADDADVRARLVEVAARGEEAALVGYLSALREGGVADAFDHLLDSAAVEPMDDLARLRLSVRGPQSPAAWQRVAELIARLSPADGARSLLYGWQNLATDRLAQVLTDWLPRIETQDNYNAVVDFLPVTLHSKPPWIESVDPLVADLVGLRVRFPDVFREEWDWDYIAGRQLEQRPQELLDLLIGLIESDDYRVRLDESDEPKLLRRSVLATGGHGWREMMNRLEAGSRQIRRIARRWLGGAADVRTVEDWIGGDIARARLVASVCALGDQTLDPIARHLILQFGDDADLTELLLSSTLLTYNWRDEESGFQSQIDLITGWLGKDEPDKVEVWVRSAIATFQSAADEQVTGDQT